MKHILILGGTGAMGNHLVNMLSQCCLGEVNLVVSTRHERTSNVHVHYVKGNAHDIEFTKHLLCQNNWDAIIDFMSYSTSEFKERYNSLLNSTDQYFYLSSSRVYAENTNPIKEDSPRLLDVCQDNDYLLTDEYALAKARQEDCLRDSGKKNWTIIRPYITFSENRLQLSPLEKENWLYRALFGKTIVFSKDISDKWTTISYGGDVAKGILALVGKEDALGEAFHITSDKSYKWSAILDLYLDIIEKKTGNRPKVAMLDKWNPSIGGAIAQVKYDRLYNRLFDNSKISRYVDISKFQDPLSTLQGCVSSFLDNIQFKDIDWAGEARRDCITGEWAYYNAIMGAKQKLKYYLVRLRLHK